MVELNEDDQRLNSEATPFIPNTLKLAPGPPDENPAGTEGASDSNQTNKATKSDINLEVNVTSDPPTSELVNSEPCVPKTENDEISTDIKNDVESVEKANVSNKTSSEHNENSISGEKSLNGDVLTTLGVAETSKLNAATPEEHEESKEDAKEIDVTTHTLDKETPKSEAEAPKVDSETSKPDVDPTSELDAKTAKAEPNTHVLEAKTALENPKTNSETPKGEEKTHEPEKDTFKTSVLNSEPVKVEKEPCKLNGENPILDADSTKPDAETPIVSADPSKSDAESLKLEAEPVKVIADSTKPDADVVDTEPSKPDVEPSELNAESTKPEAKIPILDADAESPKMEPEPAKVDVDSTKPDTKTSIVDAEPSQSGTEPSKVDAESPKPDAESPKLEAEPTKVDADAIKSDAKPSIEDLEPSKVDAESTKPDAETPILDAEPSKSEVESSKATAETPILDAEPPKVDEECTKVAEEIPGNINCTVDPETTELGEDIPKADGETSQVHTETMKADLDSTKDCAGVAEEDAKSLNVKELESPGLIASIIPKIGNIETEKLESEIDTSKSEKIGVHDKLDAPVTVPRRSKNVSESKEVETRNRDSYTATKEEIEESLNFIKSKISSTPPIPPSKAKRHSMLPKTEPKADSDIRPTFKADDDEIPGYEPIGQTIEPVYESIALESKENDDGRANTKIPKKVEIIRTSEDVSGKEFSKECIPPVRPTRSKKKENLVVPVWSPPKQNILSYLFSCFKAKSD